MNDRLLPTLPATIIVPVANPHNARTLLQFALDLLNPEAEGRVVALIVTRGNLEEDSKIIDKVEPLIEKMREQDRPVELLTRTSSNIPRGILDAAREESADMLVLGMQQPVAERIKLGSILENVIATAPCDVLIYRAGTHSDFERVVVPVDGSVGARLAAQIGIQLAQKRDRKIEAICAKQSYEGRWVGLGRIDQSLEGLRDTSMVKRTLINANFPASGILGETNDRDLILLAISERTRLERMLFGDFTSYVLNKAECSVMLVARSIPDSRWSGLLQRGLNRLDMRLTPDEQEAMMREAHDMTLPGSDYVVLVIIAAIIASLGLVLNSSAVVIGAMLVAPFMQPCVGFAVGMATAELQLVRRGLSALLVGVPLALAFAFVIGTLADLQTPTTEMLARTQPGLLDIGVAMMSGIIGAYALARKNISSALAGVAIAAALMPPLCTFGLELAAGRQDTALRAGLIFATNIVGISVAAWIVFLWLGIRPHWEDARSRSRYLWVTLAAMLAVPLVILLIALASRSDRTRIIWDKLQAAFDDPNMQVVDVRVGEQSPLKIEATVRTPQAISSGVVTTAERQLANELDTPIDLEIIEQRVVTGES
ncbi:MAG: TIGR00341 family protein [Anaerolineae bacterium]|nr:TIGR00341 family protein [Anaerolineae bacterium]